MKLNVAKLGRMDYKKALVLQEKVFDMKLEGKVIDTLLLVEHPPVLTIGRRGSLSNIVVPRDVLAANGVNIYDVSRGGDVTYHGPGQIVGYPIMDLNDHGRNIKDFVFKIEELFIRFLRNEYNIEAYRQDKKYTGVWVGDEKITAIGIAVRHWVTMHGFAFNVNTNLDHFNWIVPCGITDRKVTSLQKMLGHLVEFIDLNDKVAEYFCEVFGMESKEVKIEDLISKIME